MSQVKITEVSVVNRDDTFSATIRLDNGERYQLAVLTDSVGTVYGRLDRSGQYSKWEQLVETRNGEVVLVNGMTVSNE